MVAIAVVDDDAEARELLGGYITRFAGERGTDAQITGFTDAAELLHHYKPDYDIIFLDIEMAQVDGIKAAQVIRETDPSTVIIFVTNMAQLAIKGYEVEALDFVVKPVDYFSFDMVMRKALQRISRRKTQTIRLVTRDAMQVVPIERIDYVEVQDHYVTYHTADGDHTVKGTLGQAEQTLAAGNFMRCNRWYLVNIDNITAIDGNTITVGGNRIEVSRSKKQEILRAVTMSLGR
ncbi:LytR/AlgR family response regulator transcription factor [Bifidobacterium scardovii]|uniref:Chemotaxis protein CheY n=1 Tax=Bifidobacterium scardovii TaxID=158787 RepID=A0A087D737_9BIFI|nr:LytTR family DNA-binding domain-containing protein [Bifidobacterium scardovii]KFI91337.1 chemotaxis protein CheY [Bifidobacterium scardovii]MBS6947385.1 response regulator transcription factor [Bifidobacterium scardovii]MDK6350291.1 LytTR family DNA-binding domain-containing protein [Bifidobacterium scardovii]MDU3735995.1 LytTR family DNA-binding domain-containing protein [Bifidobacterium scardovii]MDU5296474.1 LytTR family DNA-binding domain-containing protein [Bifidobacterium scardovii]